MRPRLKLFISDDGHELDFEADQRASMRLDEFTRVLAQAMHQDSTWLQDLADERVSMSQDLYEVLTTYDLLRPARA